MPASERPLIYSKKQPNKTTPRASGASLWALAIGALALMVIGACDDGPEKSDEALVADHHAQARGARLGDLIAIEVRDWTSLHPSSQRQRQSRQLLLEFEAIDHGSHQD